MKSTLIGLFILTTAAYLLMYVWNWILIGFNLPVLNYWTALSVVILYLYVMIFKKSYK